MIYHTKTKEGDFIRVSVNSDIKVVELWATKEEHTANDFIEKATEIFENTSPDKKYRLCIFLSGSSPLLPEIKSLIKYQITHRV